MKRSTGNGAMIVAALLLTAGVTFPTDAQDTPKASTDQTQPTDKDDLDQKPDMMQCPMMAAMKDIPFMG